MRDEGKGRGRERRGRKGSGSLMEARAIYWGQGGRYSLSRGRGDTGGKGELGLFILWPFPRTNGWDV